MEIITPFEIYCICQMDTIIGLLLGLSCAALAISTFLLFVWLDSSDERTFAQLQRSFAILCVLSIACAVIPSSRTLAMMKVLPAIANNEKVQDEASELYKLAKEGLEKLTKGGESDE